jgi:hypothetical protein
MGICDEKSDLNLCNLFAFIFAETLVNSGLLCIFDAWKGGKNKQILLQKH